jgi:hypothetical protein
MKTGRSGAKLKTPSVAQTALRLPADILRRADALIPALSRTPTFAALGRVTRSTVLKLALMHGLDALEQEHK